jgi:glutamate racemase
MGQVKENCIGIFDSGIGGFSILKEIHKVLPALNVYYVADDAFAPYGNKTKDQVIERSRLIVKELLSKGASLIVVACNTATAMAIDTLREEFDVDFVGVEPFVNAISKFNLNQETRSAVITTELMGKSSRFRDLKSKYDKDGVLDYYVTKNLASIIENYFQDHDVGKLNTSLEDELQMLKKKNYSYIILGCTHYPLISKFLETHTGMKTLSPCPFVAQRVVTLSDYNEDLGPVSTFWMAKSDSDNSLRFVSKDFSNLP